MGQQLTILAALAEDKASVSSTHTEWLTITCNSTSTGNWTTSSGFPGHYCTHVAHIQTNTHQKKKAGIEMVSG